MARLLPRLLLAALPSLAWASPVAVWARETAQDHAGMDHAMPGMAMPAPGDATPDAPGDAPPPPVPADHAADRIFAADRMAAARKAMVDEMRFRTFALQVDQIEYRAIRGANGFGWDVQGWYGGDIDRVILASEGEGALGTRAERIELAGYWRHALDPWFNLQAGVRHDFRPDPQRTYALIGIEGLAPYWFEVTGQILVSEKGDIHARGKVAYQQRITQSLVIEPEAEVDFAFQAVPEIRVGSGLERLEMGARLRYERDRSLAPYVGLHWERKFGETASLARASGDGASGVSAVFGVRAMF